MELSSTPPTGTRKRRNDSVTSHYVRRAMRGDRNSLAWLIEHLSPLLLAQASYRLGDRLRSFYDPEDLVAEVWVVALPRLATLNGEGPRETPTLLRFLATTLIHRVNNLVRKHLRKDAVLREADLKAESGTVGFFAALARDTQGVVTRTARDERTRTVLACLDELEPQDREIIILRAIEQHSNQVVASRLGLKPNTVSHRYRRAMKRLKTALPDSIFAELDGA